MSKYIASILVVLHLYISILSRHMSGWTFVIVTYMIGGTIAQALFLCIHELSHNLFFQDRIWNQIFAWMCNFPIVFPCAESFRYYHLHHHKSQGVQGVDTDLPTKWEQSVFKGSLGKCLWWNFQILAYALRPILVKRQPLTVYMGCNIMLQCIFNFIFYNMFGSAPFFYLIVSLFVACGFGFHPTSAHFLSEHYTIMPTNGETFDYYGVWNRLTFNVGYHRAHHDCTTIPWSRLPRLVELAPEFFPNDCVHAYWHTLPFYFIWNNKMSLSSRVTKKSM